MTETVERYISGAEGYVAFRCRSKGEAEQFIQIIKEIVAPTYHSGLDVKLEEFGIGKYKKEICYRMEYAAGRLRYGHDSADFYISTGRRIVDVKDLLSPIDYGEFDIGFNKQEDIIDTILEGIFG